MDTVSKKGRLKYSAKFKFERAIEAIKKGDNSVVAREYHLTSGMISKWKTQLFENGFKLFETTPGKEMSNLKDKIKSMENLLGKKEVELNLIKNFTEFYQSQDT